MRKYLPIYHNKKEQLQLLDDAEVGRLIKACLDYSADGVIPNFSDDKLLNYAGTAFKTDIDLASEQYEKKVANTRKGGQTKAVIDRLGCEPKTPKILKNMYKNVDVLEQLEDIADQIEQGDITYDGDIDEFLFDWFKEEHAWNNQLS